MLYYHLIIWGVILKLGTSINDNLFTLRRKKIKGESRVIGGQEVLDMRLYPFMAHVIYHEIDEATGQPNREFIFGATILTPTHILTAAHCLTDCECSPGNCNCQEKDKDRMCVFAGSSVSQLTMPTLPCEFTLKKYHIHPSYQEEDYVHQCYSRYDIAVAELSKPLQFGDTIGSVKLPTAVSIDDDLTFTETSMLVANKTSCEVMGWGVDKYIQNRPFASDNLKVARVPLIDEYTCLYYLNAGSSPYPNKGLCPDNTQICSLDTELMNSSSLGDSGGPIVCEGKQIGIVSFGPDLTTVGVEIFTRVDVNVDWINRILTHDMF